MRRVELSSGEFAYCDDQDYELVSAYWWATVRSGQNLYAVHSRKATNTRAKVSLMMHRLILGVADRRVRVDHIDGNGLNNCRSNLRICTQRENLGNQRKRGVTSRFKGVCRYPSKTKPWQVKITVNYRLIHVGNFADEVEAALAYDEAARSVFGQYARVNFPLEGERGIQISA